MVNYQEGKIYTIRCKIDTSLIYVGSTCCSLYKRWNGHKTDYNKGEKTSPLFKSMYEKGIENFYIELYEEYPCDNKEQLNRKEGEIIRAIGTLNHQIAGRTFNEYLIENKEKVLNICKKYRENHKEQKKETDRLYRENNKEKIKDRKTELYKCECGCSFQRDNIARHNKSKFHLDFIANQTNT